MLFYKISTIILSNYCINLLHKNYQLKQLNKFILKETELCFYLTAKESKFT
jgi:hypothetical protein